MHWFAFIRPNAQMQKTTDEVSKTRGLHYSAHKKEEDNTMITIENYQCTPNNFKKEETG